MTRVMRGARNAAHYAIDCYERGVVTLTDNTISSYVKAGSEFRKTLNHFLTCREVVLQEKKFLILENQAISMIQAAICQCLVLILTEPSVMGGDLFYDLLEMASLYDQAGAFYQEISELDCQHEKASVTQDHFLMSELKGKIEGSEVLAEARINKAFKIYS